MTHLIKHIIPSLVTAFLLAGWGSHSQAQTVITADPESKIWIEGRSNINSYQCDAQQYEGQAEIVSEPTENQLELANERLRLEVKIPVRSFECGRSRMNRDMYDALRSEEYYYITFELESADVLSDGQPEVNQQTGENRFDLEITGTLTVAGVSREITFQAEGYLLNDNRLRATGKKEIRMTDYNVKPPTGMLGMVRAENELTVHFDLFASPENSIEYFKLNRDAD